MDLFVSALVLVVAVVLAVAVYRRNAGNLVSPCLVFVAVWYLPLGLSFLKLSALQDSYSRIGLLVIASVTLLMTIVFVVADIVIEGRVTPAANMKAVVDSAQTIQWDSPAILLTLIACTIITTATVYWIEFRPIGFPLLNIDESLVRSIGGLIHRYGKGSKLQVIGSTDYIVGAIAFLGLLFSSRNKPTYGALAAIPFVTGVLKLSKSDIFEPLVTYAVIGFYVRVWGKVPLAKLLRYLVVVIPLVIFMFGALVNLRNARLLRLSAPLYSDLIGFKVRTGNHSLDESMAFLYGYSSLDFVNFDRALRIEPEYHLGLSVFRPVFTLMLEGDQLDKVLNRINTNRISSSATVGTFMRDAYFEGGLWNVFLAALLYSYLISFVFVLTKLRPSVYTVVLYACFAFPLFWLPFQNAFANLNYLINPFAAIVLVRMLRAIAGRTPPQDSWAARRYRARVDRRMLQVTNRE